MKLFRQPWFWCVLGLIVLSLIWAAYRFAWPGAGFQGKTVWDWLSVLIIPLTLALVALFFNQMNTRTERQIAQQRYEQDKEAAEKRYERDQEIALDKQREDLLQAYWGHMAELLLDRGLRTSQPDAEVRNVARTRTVSVLRQLDIKRVGYVFWFLNEAKLAEPPDPVVDLSEANLSGVEWSKAELFAINLNRAILTNANLSGASLGGSYLSGADLSDVDLTGADLSDVDLSNALLNGANLSGANLNGANLCGGNFNDASFSGANLSGAYFNNTNLPYPNANLSGANLRNAQIDKTQLTPEQTAQVIW